MEEENRGLFNSPANKKNTPIKRLGLSRKRKNCDSEVTKGKMSTCDKNLNSSSNSEEIKESKGIPNDAGKCEIEESKEISNDAGKCEVEESNEIPNDAEKIENDDLESIKNYEKMEMLQAKIFEKECRLRTLERYINRVEELENLIDLWKVGCKNAILHFRNLLRERDSGSGDFRAILNELGIWETVLENFEDDPEIPY